jgi:hypothetical protein
VIAVVCTRMRCSFEAKLGCGTGLLVIIWTAVLDLSGWRMARWVVGRAAIVECWFRCWLCILVVIECMGKVDVDCK